MFTPVKKRSTHAYSNNGRAAGPASLGFYKTKGQGYSISFSARLRDLMGLQKGDYLEVLRGEGEDVGQFQLQKTTKTKNSTKITFSKSGHARLYIPMHAFAGFGSLHLHKVTKFDIDNDALTIDLSAMQAKLAAVA
jgi:hypothetical protein